MRQVLLHLVDEVMHIDDCAFNASLHEPIEHVVDEGLAGNLHQWLWHVVSEWTHTCAEPGSQHHGVPRNDSCCRCGHTSDFQWRHIGAIPGRERRQRGVYQGALQIGPYPWEMTQVLRLVVAPFQPGENAEDL